MDLIDDQGRVLGLVNVIDALVVLLVAAVVIAGVAFISQPEPASPAPPEPITQRAVLDLGTQPAYVVEQIQPGDSYAPAESSNLTVTDVYLAPQDDGVRVLLGVELTGVAADAAFAYDGAPLRLGRELTIQTDTYQVTGTIRDVGSELARGTTAVSIRQTLDAATAAEIERGDTYTIAGRAVATVESVTAYGTGDPDQRRVLVGLTLRTVDFGAGPRFGGTPVQPGSTVPFRTDDYTLAGEIRRVGAAEPRGEPATRTVTLELTNVPPYLSEAVRTGMAETAAGEPVARITDVERTPSTLVVTGQNGTVYVRDHPTAKDLTITAELSVRETATGVTFEGRTIQRGSTVVIDLGNVTIEPTVTSL